MKYSFRYSIWKAEFSGGCSADVLVFKANEKVSKDYLYYILADDEFFKYSMATSKGTKMPRGDKQQIMTYAVHIPSGTELDEFNQLAQPILAQIESKRLENIRLSSLRDSLIPKLMSGEIDISAIQF